MAPTSQLRTLVRAPAVPLTGCAAVGQRPHPSAPRPPHQCVELPVPCVLLLRGCPVPGGTRSGLPGAWPLLPFSGRVPGIRKGRGAGVPVRGPLAGAGLCTPACLTPSTLRCARHLRLVTEAALMSPHREAAPRCYFRPTTEGAMSRRWGAGSDTSRLGVLLHPPSLPSFPFPFLPLSSHSADTRCASARGQE